jgi:hypothetical protein
MTRDDLTGADPGAVTYPAALAGLLTSFAGDLPGESCPRTAS